MFLNFFYNIKNRIPILNKSEWTLVDFPKKKSLFPLILLLIYLFLSSSFVVSFGNLIRVIFYFDYIFIILVPLQIYCDILVFKLFFKYRKSKNPIIAQNLRYVIDTLSLYEDKDVEFTNLSGKSSRKRIVTMYIPIFFKEDEKKIYVSVQRNGDKWNKISNELGGHFESALGLELEKAITNFDYVDYTFLKHKDKRIEISQNTRAAHETVVNVTHSLSYDVSKVSHGLTIGGTGSGKSFYINSKVLSYSQMSDVQNSPPTWSGADIRICDPKASDLSLYRFVTGFEGKVAVESNEIAKLIRETSELVESRYREMFTDASAFGKTFIDFEGIPPVVIFIDEYAALMKTVDKKIKEEITKNIYNIVLKGRACGVFAEIILQRPDTSVLDGAIRDQLQVRVGLSNLSQEGRQMLFGSTEVEYKTITVKGGGYIFIDSVTEQPLYFETPFIEKGFDFLGEIEKINSARIAKQNGYERTNCEGAKPD